MSAFLISKLIKYKIKHNNIKIFFRFLYKIKLLAKILKKKIFMKNKLNILNYLFIYLHLTKKKYKILIVLFYLKMNLFLSKI